MLSSQQSQAPLCYPPNQVRPAHVILPIKPCLCYPTNQAGPAHVIFPSKLGLAVLSCQVSWTGTCYPLKQARLGPVILEVKPDMAMVSSKADTSCPSGLKNASIVFT
jgi:hypothetical protein